jgi:RsiW-degrading membrane proteinase PrsW (M82 family)
MKKYLFILYYFPLMVLAGNTVYEPGQVDAKPSFPGGDKAFYTFINDYTGYDACYATPKGEYPPITASFIVDSTGIVHSVKCLNSLGSFYEKMVLEALNNMPKWIPGKAKGRSVNIKMTIEIKYTIPGTDVYKKEYGHFHNPDAKHQMDQDKYKSNESQSIQYNEEKEFDYIGEKNPFYNSSYTRNSQLSKHNLFLLIIGFFWLLCSFSLAALPEILIIMLMFYWRRRKADRFKEIATCFLLGIASIFPAIIIEMIFDVQFDVGMAAAAFYSFAIIGTSEELSKFFFLRIFTLKKKNIHEPYDGILYSVIISMGFATAENILYAFQGGVGVSFVRMFTAVPAHASFAVLMGFFYGLSFFRKLPVFWMGVGLIIAILFHGVYDFFLLQNDYINLRWAIIAILAIAIFLSIKAIRIDQRYKIPIPAIIDTYEEEFTKDGL